MSQPSLHTTLYRIADGKHLSKGRITSFVSICKLPIALQQYTEQIRLLLPLLLCTQTQPVGRWQSESMTTRCIFIYRGFFRRRCRAFVDALLSYDAHAWNVGVWQLFIVITFKEALVVVVGRWIESRVAKCRFRWKITFGGYFLSSRISHAFQQC